MLSPLYSKRKDFADYTKESLRTFADPDQHGDSIFYCIYHLYDDNYRMIFTRWLCFSYNSIKTWIQEGDAKTPLGPMLHMVAAAEAGILTLIMTNPIWVVKTRLCLQYSGDTVSENTRYKGMIDALRKIYRTEGMGGLYRVILISTLHRRINLWLIFFVMQGFIPGMFGVSHGALQFMTYEEMKNRYNQYRKLPINTKLVSG